jgi:hypothetical protein
MKKLSNDWFRLTAHGGSAVACSKEGLFVGDVPLLIKSGECGEPPDWLPRPLYELNNELTERFGVSTEFASKMTGLLAVAKALNQGDIARAQVTTLHMRIPEIPSLEKFEGRPTNFLETAARLHASGLLGKDWDADKHPRWPAGTSDGVGGQFSPAGGGSQGTSSEISGGSLTQAQITIPFDFDLPEIPVWRLPFPPPTEFVPPPVAIPDVNPRDQPRNPYPRRKKCVQEWAEAEDFCDQLIKEKKLGKEPQRGQGQWRYQCVLGRVSEDCGGNATSAFQEYASRE